MKTLFLRELRRLAPYGLGSLALAAVGTALVTLTSRGATPVEDASVIGLAIAAIATPLLTAIATVAPEVESGAAAFLAVLPIASGRVVLVRWFAALVWSLAVPGLAAVVAFARVGHALLDGGVLGSCAIVAGLGFIAGIVSSVALRRTLLALVLAPAFILVPWGMVVAVLEGALGAPRDIVNVVTLAIFPLVVVAAALAHVRGDVHLRSDRSLAIVVGVVVGTLLPIFGVATGAYAYDAATSPWITRQVAGPSSADGRRAFVTQVRPRGWGETRTRRALYDFEAQRIGLVLDGWEEAPLSFSPDGKKLVTLASSERSVDSTFALHDLATGTRTPFRVEGGATHLDPKERREHRLLVAMPFQGYEGWGPTFPVWVHDGYGGLAPPIGWRRGRPVVALQGGTLVTPEERLAAPPARFVEAIAGPHAVIVDPSGDRKVLDLETLTATTEPLERLPRDAHVLEAGLSPDGRWLVLVAGTTGDATVWFVDLASSSAPCRVAGSLALFGREATTRRFLPQVVVAVAPGGRHALVRWDALPFRGARPDYARTTRTFAVELATGRSRPVTWPATLTQSPVWDRVACWSPDGRRLALRSGAILDLDAPGGEIVPTWRALAPLAFRDARRLVLVDANGGLVATNVDETTTPTPFSMEGR